MLFDLDILIREVQECYQFMGFFLVQMGGCPAYLGVLVLNQ